MWFLLLDDNNLTPEEREARMKLSKRVLILTVSIAVALILSVVLIAYPQESYVFFTHME